jgi:hypothetical protein
MAKKRISWKDKRCPKCGSPVDMLETCRGCSRSWSPELERDATGHIVEEAIGLEPGQQYESVIKPKKIGPHKLRKGKFQKSPDELAGKKFKAFSEDLPPQFAEWAIKDSDDETEIYRKRSLMRLDSKRIYDAMGLSVRTHMAQKAALLWFSKMWEFLDKEEQAALEPAMRSLKAAFSALSVVRNSKVAQATKMEIAMEGAYRQARKARIATAEKQRKEASKFPPPESDSEGLGLVPVGIESELLEQAKEKLLKLDEEKSKSRHHRKESKENNPDNGE